MSITVFEIKHPCLPQTQEEKLKFYPISCDTKFEGMFFAVGRTNTGSRYYSETVNDWDVAVKIYNDYIDVVRYFGGGNVDLYNITENGYDVVFSCVI